MGLLDKGQKETAAKQEATENTVVEEAKAVETPAAKEPTKAPAKKKPATKAVAVKEEAGALQVEGQNIFVTNAMFLSAAETASWDEFPTIKGSNGNHMVEDEKLGEEITFHVVQALPEWRCIPGSDDDAAGDYFKVSNVSKEDLEEALEEALEAGYDDAQIKKYFVLTIIVKSTEKTEGYDGEFMRMQLAPSSVKQWGWAANKCKVRAGLKALKCTNIVEGQPEVGESVLFRSTAEIGKSKTGNKYTFFKFNIV